MFGNAQTSWSNERLSIWNGSFSTISVTVVNGFVAMYVLDGLHATNSEMGLLNSLPSLVNLFSMLLAAVFVQRAYSKKLFCAAATTFSRSLYIAVALVSLLQVRDVAIWIVWIVAIMRIPQSFADLSWQALIGDLISPERRSAFFSERNRVLTIVGLLGTFLTGFILQQFDKHALWPYRGMFLGTVIFAAIEVWILLKHDESEADRWKIADVEGITRKTAEPAKSPSLPISEPTKMFRQVTRNKPFLWVASALLFFNFGWQLSWPLFSIFQIRTAHASAMWLGLFTVASSLGQIITFRSWGRMEDRFGTGRMLGVAAIGMAAAPVLTVLSTNMWYLLILNFFTGIPLAGTTLLLFNYLLEACPSDARTGYIAYYNVALSMVGFIAPEVGVWLLGVVGMSAGMLTSSILRIVGGMVFFLVSSRLRGWRGQAVSSSVSM